MYLNRHPGVVMWELFTLGDEPYSDVNSIAELAKFLQTSQRLPYPEYSNDEIYDIMKQCWHKIRSERPNFIELKIKLEEIFKQSSSLQEVKIEWKNN